MCKIIVYLLTEQTYYMFVYIGLLLLFNGAYILIVALCTMVHDRYFIMKIETTSDTRTMRYYY